MVEFFRNIVTSESSFRAAIMGAVGFLVQSPETMAALPPGLVPILLAVGGLISSGDKNPT